MTTPPRPDPRTFVYRVDAQDRIIYANAAWRAFAKRNGASRLCEEVIGSSLWAHLHGKEVRDLYRLLVDRVRQDRRTRTFPFRCDSPTIRREMEMSICALRGRAVEFRCRLVCEQPRDYVSILDDNARRSRQWIVVCAWCRKVKSPKWVDLAEAITLSRLFNHGLPPQISHGICQGCKRRVLAEAGKG